MLGHTLQYLALRALPAGAGFIGMALYTRFLNPAEYGKFAQAMAVVGLANGVVFRWLGSGLLRFYAREQSRPALLNAVARTYVYLALGAIPLLGLLLAFNEKDSRWLTIASMTALLGQAWYELNTTLVQAEMRPLQYGRLELVRALATLALGFGLAASGGGAVGLLAAATVGTIIASSRWVNTDSGLQIWGSWRNSAPLGELASYGIPLALAFSLDFVINSSDRLIIGQLLGDTQSGFYSVAYDLSHHSVGIILIAVNMSTYPRAMEAFKDGDVAHAQGQLARNFRLLFGLGLPAATGLTLLRSNVAQTVLGAGYAESASPLIGWIAFATLAAALKAFHFDIAFHLMRATRRQVFVQATAAVVNVLLTVVLLHVLGVVGAAIATFLTFVGAGALSWSLGKRLLRIPVPGSAIAQTTVATALMGLGLLPLVDLRGPLALSLQVSVGAAVYVLSAAIVIPDLRIALLRRLRQGSA